MGLSGLIAHTRARKWAIDLVETYALNSGGSGEVLNDDDDRDELARVLLPEIEIDLHQQIEDRRSHIAKQ